MIISAAPKKLAVGKQSKTHVKVKKSKKGNLHKLRKPNPFCVNRPFGQTLPGELARSIIAAGFDCPRVACHEVPVGNKTPIESPKTGATVVQHCATTQKSCWAERMAAWETKESIVGLLRNHPPCSFATHGQVASVIANSLPLHSVSTFLAAFNLVVPHPPKKGNTSTTCQVRREDHHKPNLLDHFGPGANVWFKTCLIDKVQFSC